MAWLVGEEFTVLANGNVSWAPPLCSLSPGEILLPTNMIEPHPCAVWALEKYSYQPAWLSPTPVQFEPWINTLTNQHERSPTPVQFELWRNTLTNQHVRSPTPLWLEPCKNALYQPMTVLAITVFDELTCNSCNKYILALSHVRLYPGNEASVISGFP